MVKKGGIFKSQILLGKGVPFPAQKMDHAELKIRANQRPVKLKVDPATISLQTVKKLLSLFGLKEEDYRKGKGKKEGEEGRKRGRSVDEEDAEDQEKPPDEKKSENFGKD